MTKLNRKSIAWLSSDTRAPVLIESTLCLGRSKNCNVVLSDPGVSRRHAAVHITDEDEYWISDLGGRNGVFVNDRRINRGARLQHGDLIRILRYTFRFLCSDAKSFSVDPNGSAVFAIPDSSVEERWLLIADIRSGVRWGVRAEAESYHEHLDRWHRNCRGMIEKHGGGINKFMGDGFLATWAHERQTVNSIRDALAELHEIQKSGVVPFRLVLHQAEITVGSVGTVGGESLLGPEVNYVFRMEKAASLGGFSNLISASAGKKLSSIMKLLPVALDDLTFGPGSSFFSVPGDRDRSVPLSDSDGDATARVDLSSKEEIE